MKKIILLIAFTFCCLNLFAQQEPTPTPKSDGPSTGVALPKGDFKILDKDSDGRPSKNLKFKIDPNNRQISGGVLNGKAISLPKPPYPAAAKAVRASGMVSVQVTIDEEGNIISATATSGHPLLRRAAEQAALGAKFYPTLLQGFAVKVTGVITYNFVTSENWFRIGRNLGSKTPSGLIEAGNSLPPGFSDEKKSLEKMTEENSMNGIDSLIENIETRIQRSTSDLWEYQIGTAIGRIIADPKDSNSLRTNLLKIRQLTDFPPANVYTTRLESMKELANFSNIQKLSKKDKATIIELCHSIQ